MGGASVVDVVTPEEVATAELGGEAPPPTEEAGAVAIAGAWRATVDDVDAATAVEVVATAARTLGMGAAGAVLVVDLGAVTVVVVAAEIRTVVAGSTVVVGAVVLVTRAVVVVVPTVGGTVVVGGLVVVVVGGGTNTNDLVAQSKT